MTRTGKNLFVSASSHQPGLDSRSNDLKALLDDTWKGKVKEEDLICLWNPPDGTLIKVKRLEDRIRWHVQGNVREEDFICLCQSGFE